MPGATIASSSEITLITLQNCSANISFLSEIFEKIAALEVNVDMISLSPHKGPSPPFRLRLQMKIWEECCNSPLSCRQDMKSK